MKISGLFVMIISLVLSSCSGPSGESCAKFRTGTFVYAGGKGADTRIVRTETTQVESSEKEGFRDEYAIEWLNDCKYQAVLTATSNPENTMLELGDTITVMITGTEGNRYDYLLMVKGQQMASVLEKVE